MLNFFRRITFVVFFLFSTTVLFAADTSTIHVTKFEFMGVKRTPKDQLKAISSRYIQSPLLGNWPDSMIAEIEKIPMVKEAHLIRDLTGTVTISINERKPIGNLSLDQYEWIDQDGNIIQSVPDNELESMVFFSGPWKSVSDYQKKNGASHVQEAIQLYGKLVDLGFPEKKISELHFDANLGWMMYRVESRAPIVFGNEDLAQKAERFVQIVPNLAPIEREIVKVDADFHDRVVVKLASFSK